MLKQDHNLLHKNALFNLRKLKKEESRFVRMKRICFLIGVILSLIIITTIYFISSHSNIYRITIKGNNYLKDEDIIKLSELSFDDKYILTFPMKREADFVTASNDEDGVAKAIERFVLAE